MGSPRRAADYDTAPLTRIIFEGVLYHINHILYGGQIGLCAKVSMDLYSTYPLRIIEQTQDYEGTVT